MLEFSFNLFNNQILLTSSQPTWRSSQRSSQQQSSIPTSVTLLSTAAAKEPSVCVTWGVQLCATNTPNVRFFEPPLRYYVCPAIRKQESRFLCLYIYTDSFFFFFFPLLDLFSVRGARRSKQSLVLLWDHILHLRCQVQSQWTLHDDQRLLVCKDLGFKYGEQASRNLSGESGLAREWRLFCTFLN